MVKGSKVKGAAQTFRLPAVASTLARAARGFAALDRAALISARTHFHTPQAESCVRFYSRLGEHGACWLVLGGAGALLDRPNRARWLRGARELAGLPPLTKTVSRLSFPSAHATTSFAAARAFAGLVSPACVYVPAYAFAVSRPYLGVHYPSDVIAGALLCTAIAEGWPAEPEAGRRSASGPPPPGPRP
jgi:undecaprenyl-diphosphatase